MPYAALPLNVNVNDVELLNVTDEAVRPVVPTPIVNRDNKVEVSNPVPVTVTVGLEAPFAIVDVVAIVGAETDPTVYVSKLEDDVEQSESPFP